MINDISEHAAHGADINLSGKNAFAAGKAAGPGTDRHGPAVEIYPHHAGAKEHTTSLDAAIGIESTGRAETLRLEALRLFQNGFVGTADELAHTMGEMPWNVRPRCSELHVRGLIEKTGARRKADGGRCANVWQLT